ncbi:MAG: helix-turn-helix transcriptional regulator [Geobacter sp.]|nr:helix-turn-helix transcriptional regulator [Geobacter sp.]
MPRRAVKNRTPEEIRREKEALYANLEAGKLTLGQATRRMRKIVGLTQVEYAEKVLKIYPRVLMEIEKDRGNPTLETLEKIARPFGLTVGFIRRSGRRVEMVRIKYQILPYGLPPALGGGMLLKNGWGKGTTDARGRAALSR